MSAERLQRALGHAFARPALLDEALTHRSFGQPHNERFEFLGDSVLNCVISIALCERFPALREGELSRLRASLVRQEALHQIAEKLDLGACLRLGEGERRSGGHRRPSILADALEAVFAAVFLDAGFDAAQTVILRLYSPLLDEVDPRGEPPRDPKTALQEWLQARRRPLPVYVMVQVLGEAHAQEFEVACEAGNPGVRTVARGGSRRAAEQKAAELALVELKKND